MIVVNRRFLFSLLVLMLVVSGCNSSSEDSTSSDQAEDLMDGPAGSDGYLNTDDSSSDGGAEVLDVSWTESVILSREGRNGFNPHATINADGDALAAWIDSDTDPQLRAAYRDADASSWTDSVRLDVVDGDIPEYDWNYVYYSRVNPQVAMDGDQGFVVWAQESSESQTSIFGVHHNGVAFGAATKIASDINGSAGDPRVVAYGGGNATVVYVQGQDVAGDDPKLMAVHYDKETSSWSSAEMVASGVPTTGAGDSVMTVTPGGVPALLWFEDGDNGRNLNFQLYSGGSWSEPETVATGAIRSADLAFDPVSGRVVVVYNEGEDLYSDDLTVYVRERDIDGGSWSAAMDLNSNDNPAYAPEIVALGNGELLAMWGQNDGLGSGTYWIDAASRLYQPNNGGWQDVVIVDDLGGALPKLATMQDGQAIAAWHAGSTYEAVYSDGWSSKATSFGYDGEEHSIAANANGEAVMIGTSGSSDREVEVKLLK